MKKNTRKVINILNPAGEILETFIETNDYIGPEVLLFNESNFQIKKETAYVGYLAPIGEAKINIYNAIQNVINLSNRQKDDLNDFSKKKIKSYFNKMKSALDKVQTYPDNHFVICMLHEDVKEVKEDISEEEKEVIYTEASKHSYLNYHREVINRLFVGYYNGWTFSPSDWAKTKKFKSFVTKRLEHIASLKILPNDRLFEMCGEVFYKFSISLEVPEEVIKSEFDNETFQNVFRILKQCDIAAIKGKDKDGFIIELVTKFDNKKVM